MLSDLEDNTFKISIPIITNEELERFNNYLETDLDKIVNEISTHISRDREIILLKKVIEKQSKEIKELKDESKEYQIGFAQGCYEKDLDWKDKIKAKIEEVDYKMISHQDVREAVKEVLNSLLKKE